MGCATTICIFGSLVKIVALQLPGDNQDGTRVNLSAPRSRKSGWSFRAHRYARFALR